LGLALLIAAQATSANGSPHSRDPTWPNAS
jgi:hypothetical protein